MVLIYLLARVYAHGALSPWSSLHVDNIMWIVCDGLITMFHSGAVTYVLKRLLN